VLDVGTGTGLLAMMAARLGADSVTACEVSLLVVFAVLLKPLPLSSEPVGSFRCTFEAFANSPVSVKALCFRAVHPPHSFVRTDLSISHEWFEQSR